MAEKPLIQAGLYQHYKGGLYKVIGVAKHSETLELMVLYEAQSNHDLWVRPYTMFNENVNINGEDVPRFKFLHP